MSQISTLLQHARNYSLASLLTTVAGLISFPILTRVLEVEDYGLMGLLATSLALAVGLGKLGMQHAVLRFHSQVAAGNMPGVQASSLMPTAMYGTAGLALFVLLAWLAAVLLLPASVWSNARLPSLMLLASVLVFSRVLDSACNSVMRARQHTGTMAIVVVARRYLTLAGVLGAVLLIAPTVHHVYGAIVLAEVGVCVATLWFLLRREPMSPRRFDPALFKTMLLFAAPMTAYELSIAVKQIGNRYVLEAFLGSAQVGLYSAAVNLCEYVYEIVFLSVTAAALPMCLRMADKDGMAAVQAFLARFTHRYLMLTACVVALVGAVSYDFLALVASEKYREGAVVIPYAMLGMAFNAFTEIAALGLFLAKRTVVMTVLLYGGAALNFAANLLLVPRFGIAGSGMANIVSDLGVLIVAFYWGRKLITPPPFVVPMFKFAVCALVACAAAWQIDLGLHLFNLIVRSGVVLIVFGALGMACDAGAREIVRGGWERIRSRFGVAARA